MFGIEGREPTEEEIEKVKKAKKIIYQGFKYALSQGLPKESAAILLNGKKITTLIGPSYSVTIPAAELQPDNMLEIIVTNGMANRIIDLDKRGISWKKFYNINMSARLPENRGADGLFTAAKWQPKPSGLLGPVTITPLKYE